MPLPPGGAQLPTLSHRSKMVFTEACLCETLRLGTHLPLSFPVQTTCDTSVGESFHRETWLLSKRRQAIKNGCLDTCFTSYIFLNVLFHNIFILWPKKQLYHNKNQMDNYQIVWCMQWYYLQQTSCRSININYICNRYQHNWQRQSLTEISRIRLIAINRDCKESKHNGASTVV